MNNVCNPSTCMPASRWFFTPVRYINIAIRVKSVNQDVTAGAVNISSRLIARQAMQKWGRWSCQRRSSKARSPTDSAWHPLIVESVAGLSRTLRPPTTPTPVTHTSPRSGRDDTKASLTLGEVGIHCGAANPSTKTTWIGFFFRGSVCTEGRLGFGAW